jgi:hypothetical protein
MFSKATAVMLRPGGPLESTPPHKNGKSRSPEILHVGPADPEMVATIQERRRKRLAYMDSVTIGVTGESGIRQEFMLAKAAGGKQFLRISQRGRNGHIRLKGSNHLADLVIDYRSIEGGPARRLLVECKNTREEYNITSDEILATLIREAKNSGTQPVLVCAYLAEAKRRYLSDIGIAYHVLGRQFLPSDWKSKITREGLIPADLLASNFQFLNPNRPFRPYRSIDPRTLHDVDVFNNSLWLDAAYSRWNTMNAAGVLEETAHLIESKKLHELNDLLRQYR